MGFVSFGKGVSVNNNTFAKDLIERTSTNITIPDYITKIGVGAFRDFSILENIFIPNSVESIEARAFMSCVGLTNISIPNKVQIIKTYTFYGCTSFNKYINI